MTTAPIQCIHQAYKPADCSWQDDDRFSAFLFIDDGIFAEGCLGNRADDCIILWEDIARNILDDDCINAEKMKLRGNGVKKHWCLVSC